MSSILAGLLLGVPLCLGGLLLLKRHSVGRTLCIIGSTAAFAAAVAGSFLDRIDILSFFADFGVLGLFGWIDGFLVAAAPAVATFVLTLVTPTARWVGKQPAVPAPPYGYPPQAPPPGYRPQGQWPGVQPPGYPQQGTPPGHQPQPGGHHPGPPPGQW